MLLLLLLCLIGPSLQQPRLDPKEFTHFELPLSEFENGCMLTFVFKHIETNNERGIVNVNLYNEPIFKYPPGGIRNLNPKDDIPAHIRMERDGERPVATNSFVSGRWGDETRKKQRLAERPPADGWWRLDVVKLSEFELLICFQGYWTDVRRFALSLDKIQSIYVMSKAIDHNNMHVFFTGPDRLYKVWLNRATFEEMIPKEPVNLNPIEFGTFYHFDVRDGLYATVFLRSFGERTKLEPEIFFVSMQTNKPVFKIYQLFHWDLQWGWVLSTDIHLFSHADGKSTKCTSMKRTGDLEHIRIERSTESEIRLIILYRDGLQSESCTHKVPDLATLTDGFKVFGGYGGFPITIGGPGSTYELRQVF